jgi:hypothetical protein
LFRRRRVCATGDRAQESSGLVAGGVGNPRGAVPADGVPTLPAVPGAEDQDIRDRALLCRRAPNPVTTVSQMTSPGPSLAISRWPMRRRVPMDCLPDDG